MVLREVQASAGAVRRAHLAGKPTRAHRADVTRQAGFGTHAAVRWVVGEVTAHPVAESGAAAAREPAFSRRADLADQARVHAIPTALGIRLEVRAPPGT